MSVNSNTSAVLTTHSMEEVYIDKKYDKIICFFFKAEALCQRIGIMVNGELK